MRRKRKLPVKPSNEKWLGGEAHVGHVDPRSAVARRLKGLRSSRAFLLGFGFASGLVIGTGLAVLLSHRRRKSS